MKKILFFDIDGTLISYGHAMEESTLYALQQAKAMGHDLVICTGRIREDMPVDLPQELFDGFVCASGGYIEWKGKEILRSPWKKEQVNQFIDFALRHDLIFHFQCKGRKCILEEQYPLLKGILREEAIRRGIPPMPFSMERMSEKALREINDGEKVLYHGAKLTLKELQNLLSADYEITGSSFSVEDGQSGEVTLRGINKAAGMERLLAYIGVAVEDSIAYGDGPNDYEMLEFAGVGVAMGNADDDLKSKADMVTDAVYEDGIYNSMRTLGLLGE